jgi:hypothetical protein
MGMFDVVRHRCSCGGTIEWQSKAGECLLNSFSKDKVPLHIAVDINDEVVSCYDCKKRYKIHSDNIPLPQTVAMEVIETEEEADY